jgi:hypothetical protein
LDILGPYPAALNDLRNITQPVQSATKYAIVYVVSSDRVIILTGMPQPIMVIIFVGTLVQAQIVCKYGEFATHRVSDSLECPKAPIYVDVQSNRIGAQGLKEFGSGDTVDMSNS